jgi:type VI secretion system protein ImpC
MERSDCEAWLNRWIKNYTLANPETASFESKAKRPLREARVDVRDDPSRPGCYEAVAYLRPHFQMEELSVGLSLVAKLPESRAR